MSPRFQETQGGKRWVPGDKRRHERDGKGPEMERTGGDRREPEWPQDRGAADRYLNVSISFRETLPSASSSCNLLMTVHWVVPKWTTPSPSLVITISVTKQLGSPSVKWQGHWDVGRKRQKDISPIQAATCHSLLPIPYPDSSWISVTVGM